jgi:hypothetical protein
MLDLAGCVETCGLQDSELELFQDLRRIFNNVTLATWYVDICFRCHD